MINEEQQKTIIDGVKALSHGLDREAKADRQQTLMVGVVLALNAVDVTLCPPHWYLNVMSQRVDRIVK